MRRVLLLMVAFSWAQSLYASAEGDCLDGNTCLVTSGAYSGPVRLFCVDTPPVSNAIGRQAWTALNREYRGTVRILMDSQDNGVPIAEFIRDDGWNLGLELIRSGLAKVDRRYCDEISYTIAENEAKDAGHGLWFRLELDPAK